MMEHLYYAHPCACVQGGIDYEINLPDDLLEKILKRIHAGSDTMKTLDPDLFFASLQEIDKAVDEGIPSVRWGEENKDFIDALKYNNAVFAAFKTHREQNDLHAQLVDSDGQLKDFSAFRKACQSIIGDYNGRWLKTEYDTAVKSARTAAKFIEYEKDEDIYPNLTWMPSTAVEPRETHKRYYHTVRAMRDPWFKTHYPGNEWGCQCDVNNTDSPITHQGDEPVGAIRNEIPPPGLGLNPAFSKSIFSRTHPYVTEGYLPEHKLRKLLIPLVNELLQQKR
jgi:hypothetical protein